MQQTGNGKILYVGFVFSFFSLIGAGYSLYLDHRQDKRLEASIAIEKRPQVELSIEKDSSSFVKKYGVVGISSRQSSNFAWELPAGDTTTIKTTINVRATVKVRAFNKSANYSAIIRKVFVGFSADKGYMLRDILLMRYRDPVRTEGIEFIDEPQISPTQIQPGDEISFKFTIPELGFDTTSGQAIVHIILVYENEYGVTYDSYKRVIVKLNQGALFENTKRLIVSQQTGFGYLLNSDVEFDDSPPYTFYTYSVVEERILSKSILNIVDLMDHVNKFRKINKQP
jgi:hypothetical protein